MKILMVGSGAIGSFIGGSLANSGQDVTFLDLPAVVSKLKENGLKIEGLSKSIHVKNPDAITDLNSLSHFDLVIFAVRSFCTKNVMEEIGKDIAPRIISFQNGIGNEEILSEKFGKSSIIAGSVTYPIAYPEPGVIHVENQRAGIGISAMEPATDISDIKDMFEKAGLNVIRVQDYRSLKWSKLLLNIICNASCAILGMTPGEIFSNLRLVRIERLAVLEALRVMNKMKIKAINLPGYPAATLAFLYSYLPSSALMMLLGRRIKSARGDKKPSLLLALDGGATMTEIKSLNGAIYTNAYNVSLPAHVNKIMTETLEDIVRGNIPREEIKGKPDAFLNLFRRV